MSVGWYDSNIEDLSHRYESLAAEAVHAWLVDLLPSAPALVLDVGAGTGRDAAWLASRGLEVVAVEPSGAMRAEAQRLHPSPSIRWVSDSLPALDHVFRLGLSFDLILLSAVWMHVPPADRARGFRKLVTLLKPGGRIAITLRQGPAEPERGIYAVTRAEIESLTRAHGAFVECTAESKDKLGRDAVAEFIIHLMPFLAFVGRTLNARNRVVQNMHSRPNSAGAPGRLTSSLATGGNRRYFETLKSDCGVSLYGKWPDSHRKVFRISFLFSAASGALNPVRELGLVVLICAVNIAASPNTAIRPLPTFIAEP